jgi:hypothetical protein
MFYSVTVIVVMGVAQPLWLRLPVRGSASSLARKSDSAYSSLEKKMILSQEPAAIFDIGMGHC